ncbi:PTS fructose-like transporter subunit IIB, partial [Raoultella ornithinolytica]|nr:PTS fructose-like transporter subunit IIB [Raoultella ornithinolytica]
MTRIIAVTACPSGVAHTYMAAESLESAATAKGWQVKVETQGSIGIENELSADDVASADIVILTKDIGIKSEERFA